MSRHLIIVGAAKSGTSTLFQYLDQHSRVNTSAGKEPHFFCDGFYERYEKTGTVYKDLWDEDQGDIFAEASTGYSKHPVITGAPENMAAYGLSPKIIYIVREPISRLRSHIKYMMWRTETQNVDAICEAAIVSSMYYSQIRRYVDVFGDDTVKLVLLGELSAQPTSCMKEVFRFTGVDPVPIDTTRRDNQTRNVTNLELAVRSTPIWRLKSLLSNSLKSRIRSVWNLFSSSPEVDVLSDIDPDRILAMCEDALRLEELFDVDLGSWRETIDRSKFLDGIHRP